MSMTPEDVREVAKAAAEATVNEVFLRLGVDVNQAGALADMRKDFNHLRSWRESTDTIKKHGLIAAIGLVTIGVLALLWTAIKGG